MRKFVGVLAHRAHLFGHARVADIGEVHVVDLEVIATCAGKFANFFAIDSRNVGIELVDLGIGVAIDRLATSAKM